MLVNRPKFHMIIEGIIGIRKAFFFKLPYWSSLLLWHNLDVMHIEKNICDNVLGTIMNIKGKTKDTVKSHLDFEAINIIPKLHPI